MGHYMLRYALSQISWISYMDMKQISQEFVYNAKSILWQETWTPSFAKSVKNFEYITKFAEVQFL